MILPLINEGKHSITGNQILKPETVKEMFKGQLNDQTLPWLHRPTPANGMQELIPDVKKQWGLGMILTPEGMYTGRGHYAGAWAGFPNTHWVADPEAGILFVQFTQIIPQEDGRFMSMRYEVEKLVYSSLKGEN
jgi:CubicO group peptidase (beta-lactamase class C family)